MRYFRYVIHEGEPPPGFESVLNEPVYYSDAYLAIQDYEQLSVSLLLDTETLQIVGKAIFSVEKDGRKISLPRAPFGGICCADYLSKEDLHSWLTHLLTAHTVITQPASIYTGYCHLLAEMNAQRESIELNHHIDLSDYHLAKLHNMQIRRIRKCKNAGFELREATTESELEKVHEFIADCRLEQGLVINIAKSQLMRSFALLPDHYRAFTVSTPSGEMVAATIVVRVTNGIAYNYLPASTKKYHNYSPMAFLLFRVALQYQSEGYDLLDLGISSVDEEEQQSLARFKERMGAIRSNKTTYHF